MQLPGNKNYQTGKEAEDKAASFLINKGYEILHRRYLTHHLAEVDIVAVKENKLAFIEVKARKYHKEEYISVAQCKRYISAAENFLGQNTNYENFLVRFDLIVVINGNIHVHLENAWSGFDFY